MSVFMTHGLFLFYKKIPFASRMLIFCYILGALFYIVIPSYLPMFLGEQIIHARFVGDVSFGSMYLDKIYIVILVYSIFSILGILFGLSISVNKNYKDRLYDNDSVMFPFSAFMFFVLLRYFLIYVEYDTGIVAAGERSGGVSSQIYLVINTLMLVTMAYLISILRSKKSQVLIVLVSLSVYLAHSILISGSRRMAVFYFMFIVGPTLIGLKIIKLSSYIIYSIFTIIFVVVYGAIRANLFKFTSFDELYYEAGLILEKLRDNIDLVLINADITIVYDAFVGVIKNVPEKVDYLYGETLFKFFYFIIPRSVWPDKPESISVLVSKNIHGAYYITGTTYNPTLLGELFYNGGYVATVLGGLLIGLLVGFFVKKSGLWVNDGDRVMIVFIGIIGMTFFNVWRGYTFEVIIYLLLSFVIYVISYKFLSLKNYKFS